MSQADNLAALATNVNSSGVLQPASGGTGLTSSGSNGNVLTSNGTAWVSSAPTTTSPGGSTTQVQFNNAGAFGGSANFVFDGTNVGIGTSSPASNLHIAGTTSAVVSRVSATTGAPYSLYTNSGSNFFVGKENSASGSFGTTAYASLLYEGGAYPMVFFTNAAERMRITSTGVMYLGPLATNFSFTNGSAVDISGSGTGIAGNGTNLTLGVWNGPMVFQAGNNGSALTERMRITSAGNVGIGTSSPGAKLQVTTGGANSPGSNLSGNIGQFTSSGGIAYVTMGNGDSANQHRYVGAASAIQVFGKVTDAGVATEQMRLSAAGGLGVGTTSDPGAGAIYATGNITAFFSDERLKTKTGDIENALDKVCQIETMLYHANETAVALGYDASIQEVGVTAQSVQKVQPEIVVPAPIDDKYLTVRYEKLVPLLIEAIKELKAEIDVLKAK
jgi:hypothetical protein